MMMSTHRSDFFLHCDTATLLRFVYLPSKYYLLLSFIQIAVTYQTLDSLQEHGIAANDIQKLNDAGYHTVESVSA